MYSDEEAYNMMKQLVSEGKYRKAYDFCTEYKCKGNAYKTSMECSKEILQFINSNSKYRNNFHWDDNYKEGSADIHNIAQDSIMDRVVAFRINELRTLFGINQR